MSAIPYFVIVVAALLAIVGRIIGKPDQQREGKLERFEWEQ